MKIAATMIDEVAMSAVTGDGRHVALTLRESCGNLMTLGLPSAAMPRLINHAARALSARRSLLRGDEEGNGAIAVTWWNLLRDCQTGGFVLSLTFGSGSTLDFSLTERMASCMLDTLRCHALTNPPTHDHPDQAGANGTISVTTYERWFCRKLPQWASGTRAGG